MARRLPVHKLKTNAKALNLGSAKVYHLPDWHNLSHPDRLKVIRQIAMMRGRDPRIAQLAVKIIRKGGARPRQYKKQAAAILKWVQDPKNIYYVNEPGERLQDPIYTIKQGHADCDDQVLVLCSLFESVGLPWRLVLSGRGPKGKARYIEGQPVPPGTQWTHIYCMVGDKPFRPNTWYFAEPTVEGVPLGWDVVSGDASYLPEMAKPRKGPARIAKLKRRPASRRRGKLPPMKYRSPVYEEALAGYGSALIPVAVGASIAEEEELSHSTKEGEDQVNWTKLGTAILTGVAVSVGTSLLLDWVKGDGMWSGRGHLAARWAKNTESLAEHSFLSAPSPLG